MQFYVYRSGWNAANQPSAYSAHTVLVATVEADSAEDACALAAERVTVYNGQYLSASEAADVDEREAAIDSKVKLA